MLLDFEYVYLFLAISDKYFTIVNLSKLVQDENIWGIYA